MLQCNFWMIHSARQHPSWSQVDSLLPATALRGCSWTGNHRSVRFIFGSESSSPRRFLGIAPPSKWLESAWNAWKTRFRQSIFQQFLGRAPRLPARGLRAFGARRRLAPPAATPRTSTQYPLLSGKHARDPKNRFHPVRLWSRDPPCMTKVKKSKGQVHKVTWRISRQKRYRPDSAVDGHINFKLGGNYWRRGWRVWYTF